MYDRVLDRRTIWIILFAGILLAGTVVLMSLYDSTFAQDAAIEYAENGTDPVAVFTAVDPENKGVAVWSLKSVEDDNASLFTIDRSSGELSFKKSPNYEKSSDGRL